MQRVLRSGSAEQTAALGMRLAALLRPGDVVSLAGDLGAGKTCLVGGVAAGLGVMGRVTSPTFNILLVHRGGRLVLNHIDLYRIEREDQLEDIALWETLEGDGASFVEWGDRFAGALPADRLDVTISITGDEERSLQLVSTGQRSEELAGAWAAAAAGVSGDAP